MQVSGGFGDPLSDLVAIFKSGPVYGDAENGYFQNQQDAHNLPSSVITTADMVQVSGPQGNYNLKDKAYNTFLSYT